MTNPNRSTIPLAKPWMIHPVDFQVKPELEVFDDPMGGPGLPQNPDVRLGRNNWGRAYLEAGERYAAGHLTGDFKMVQHALEWLAVAAAFRPEPAFSQYLRQAEHLFNQGMYLAWCAAAKANEPLEFL